MTILEYINGIMNANFISYSEIFESAKFGFENYQNATSIYVDLLTGRCSDEDVKEVWIDKRYNEPFYPYSQILQDYKSFYPINIKVDKKGGKYYICYDYRNTEGDMEYFTTKGKSIAQANRKQIETIKSTVTSLVGVENEEYKKFEAENEGDWFASMFGNMHEPYLNKPEIEAKIQSEMERQSCYNLGGYTASGFRSCYAIKEGNYYKMAFYIHVNDRGYDNIGLVCSSSGGIIYEISIDEKTLAKI